MSPSICRLCGSTAKLVDSHVLPKSFFPLGDNPKILNVKGEEPPKRSPKGVYDQIVCESCERKFSAPDDYAFEVLGALKPGAEPQILTLDVDYVLLKRFVISLLWRAGISSQIFYENVTLGPFESRLRELVRTGQPGSVDEFSFWLVRVEEVQIGVIKPVPRRFKFTTGYRNYFLFAFASVMLHIKLDQRPPTEFLSVFSAKPGSPLIVPAISLAATHLQEPIFQMIRNNSNAFGTKKD